MAKQALVSFIEYSVIWLCAALLLAGCSCHEQPPAMPSPRPVPQAQQGGGVEKKAPTISIDQSVGSMGLVHAGLTGEDADGKTATLSLVIRIAGEDADSKLWLDVEVKSDLDEEMRVRSHLGLPRQVAPGDRIPVALKWNGVSGRNLYSMLTDDSDGLVFVLVSGETRPQGIQIGSVCPGKVLLSHPANVKDLTNEKEGMSAFSERE